jgi:hypothetical protein
MVHLVPQTTQLISAHRKEVMTDLQQQLYIVALSRQHMGQNLQPLCQVSTHIPWQFS